MMDEQKFKELFDVCCNKYKHFRDDFDTLLYDIGDIVKELGWFRDETKIINTSNLRSLAKQKAIEELTIFQSFTEKYPEFKPLLEHIRDLFANKKS